MGGARSWAPVLGALGLVALVALGEAAEALGEFDEALGADQAAARRSPSTTTWLRLGEMADRMAQVDLAIQSLDHAHRSWREHASLGLKVGVAVFATCVPRRWPSPSELWTVWLPSATRAGRPDREVPKLAGSRNVTSWRVQHRHNNPDAALATYTKAIAADPGFSAR